MTTEFKSMWEAFECGVEIGFKRWDAFEVK
jgi:hypothetical protein